MRPAWTGARHCSVIGAAHRRQGKPCHDAAHEALQQHTAPDPSGGGKTPPRPLQASNATPLAQYNPWASTAVVGAASMPASRLDDSPQDAGNIPLPDLPPTLLDPVDDVGPLVW